LGHGTGSGLGFIVFQKREVGGYDLSKFLGKERKGNIIDNIACWKGRQWIVDHWGVGEWGDLGGGQSRGLCIHKRHIRIKCNGGRCELGK